MRFRKRKVIVGKEKVIVGRWLIMKFKIGDYVVDGFGNIFLLHNKWFRDIANAHSEKFRLASKEEIEKYNARQLMGV